MRTYYFSSQQGFTLIEVLIALTIFSLGILAISGLTVNFFTSSRHIENQSLALDIMRTGIESAIQMRNKNWLDNASYDEGFANGDYCIDYAFKRLTRIKNYRATDINDLFFVPTSSQKKKALRTQLESSACNTDYDFSALAPSSLQNLTVSKDVTIFTHKVSTTPVAEAGDNPAYLKVESIVSWDQGEESVSGELHMYNWRNS